MAGKKPTFETFTTPKGIAVYPKLNTPDEFKGKRSYSVKLVLAKDAIGDLIEKIEAAADKAFEDAKVELAQKIEEAAGAKKGPLKAKLAKLEKADLPIKPQFDDEGNETDNVILNIKMAASYKDKNDKEVPLSPKIFDSKGNQMKNPPDIWGGSTLRVSGQLVPFNMPATDCAGVSLRLGAVQVIELVTRGSGASADSYGFGKEDGGYEAEDDAATGAATDDEVTGAASGEEADDKDF